MIREMIAILDFGSQYAQLIARRVREHNVYSRIFPARISRRGAVEAAAQGHHPLRRAGQRLRAQRPPLRRADLRPRRPDPRHLLRHAARLPDPRRRGHPRQEPRVRPGQPDDPRQDRPLRDPARRDARLDQPRRPGRQPRPRASSRSPRPRPAPTPRCATRNKPFFGVQFHPEVTHTPKGAADPEELPLRHLRLHRRLEDERLHRRDGPERPQAGRRRHGHLRPQRRRRLLRRRRAAPPGHRRPARLHLRGQRPAPQERAGEHRLDLPRPLPHRPARRRLVEPVPRRPWPA